MRSTLASLAAIAIATVLACTGARHADAGEPPRLERVVDEAVRPVMERHRVPGMIVAVTVHGKHAFFKYGVASRESGRPVDESTIFEIGSVSKTFTATLASYARERGALSFSDKASAHLPALAGTRFDGISLIDLGIYTAGGLPLQFPREVVDQDTLMAYVRSWRPTYEPGTWRVYSNPSIGLFGLLAARSLGQPFDDLMEWMLFPMLGLTSTYIQVPPQRMSDYASGYTRDDKPIRVAPGVLDSEAYGVKTNAIDMLRYVDANMTGTGLVGTLQRAIAATHAAYYQVGDMMQGLGWELYAYPTDLERLLEGNSERALKPGKVTRLPVPPSERNDVLINKTGSTNGFGAYVAFVPAKGIGVVLMANKNYPNGDRVKAAYEILTALDRRPDMMNVR